MVKGQTARADPVWPWVERGIEVSSYCPARLTLVLPKLRKLSVTRKRRKPPNIREGLVYQCFHVRSEVLVALVVKLSAGELGHLLAIGEDVSSHCGLGSTERKAHDGHLKALGIKRPHWFPPPLVST